MNRDPDERSQPDGGPAPDEFDAIVAGWQREGRVPTWPEDEHPAASLFEPPTEPRPEPVRPVEMDHFVPPEPPPLPRIGPPAIVGLVLLGLGLVLIITPGWVGVGGVYGLPLGLLALASGLGWLVLRLWPDAPSSGADDGEDDGAVL